jgi:hypothetical protein
MFCGSLSGSCRIRIILPDPDRHTGHTVVGTAVNVSQNPYFWYSCMRKTWSRIRMWTGNRFDEVTDLDLDQHQNRNSDPVPDGSQNNADPQH